MLALSSLIVSSAHTLELAAESSLDGLALVSGHWTTAVEGMSAEALWAPPADGLMVGVDRVSGSTDFFEYLRIEAVDGALDHVAAPAGAAEARLRLAASDDSSARFANEVDHWPRESVYRLETDGTLAVSARGLTETRVLNWSFQRAR